MSNMDIPKQIDKIIHNLLQEGGLKLTMKHRDPKKSLEGLVRSVLGMDNNPKNSISLNGGLIASFNNVGELSQRGKIPVSRGDDGSLVVSISHNGLIVDCAFHQKGTLDGVPHFNPRPSRIEIKNKSNGDELIKYRVDDGTITMKEEISSDGITKSIDQFYPNGETVKCRSEFHPDGETVKCRSEFYEYGGPKLIERTKNDGFVERLMFHPSGELSLSRQIQYPEPDGEYNRLPYYEEKEFDELGNLTGTKYFNMHGNSISNPNPNEDAANSNTNSISDSISNPSEDAANSNAKNSNSDDISTFLKDVKLKELKRILRSR